MNYLYHNHLFSTAISTFTELMFETEHDHLLPTVRFLYSSFKSCKWDRYHNGNFLTAHSRFACLLRLSSSSPGVPKLIWQLHTTCWCLTFDNHPWSYSWEHARSWSHQPSNKKVTTFFNKLWYFTQIRSLHSYWVVNIKVNC